MQDLVHWTAYPKTGIYVDFSSPGDVDGDNSLVMPSGAETFRSAGGYGAGGSHDLAVSPSWLGVRFLGVPTSPGAENAGCFP